MECVRTTARRYSRNGNPGRRAVESREQAPGYRSLPLVYGWPFGFSRHLRLRLSRQGPPKRRGASQPNHVSRVPDFVWSYPSDEAIEIRDVQLMSKARKRTRQIAALAFVARREMVIWRPGIHQPSCRTNSERCPAAQAMDRKREFCGDLAQALQAQAKEGSESYMRPDTL